MTAGEGRFDGVRSEEAGAAEDEQVQPGQGAAGGLPGGRRGESGAGGSAQAGVRQERAS